MAAICTLTSGTLATASLGVPIAVGPESLLRWCYLAFALLLSSVCVPLSFSDKMNVLFPSSPSSWKPFPLQSLGCFLDILFEFCVGFIGLLRFCLLLSLP